MIIMCGVRAVVSYVLATVVDCGRVSITSYCVERICRHCEIWMAFLRHGFAAFRELYIIAVCGVSNMATGGSIRNLDGTHRNRSGSAALEDYTTTDHVACCVGRKQQDDNENAMKFN